MVNWIPTFCLLNNSLRNLYIPEKRHLHGIRIPRPLGNHIIDACCCPRGQAHGDIMRCSCAGCAQFAICMGEFVRGSRGKAEGEFHFLAEDGGAGVEGIYVAKDARE